MMKLDEMLFWKYTSIESESNYHFRCKTEKKEIMACGNSSEQKPTWFGE